MTKAERRKSWLGERTRRAGMAMGPRASAVLHVRAAALGGAKRPPSQLAMAAARAHAKEVAMRVCAHIPPRRGLLVTSRCAGVCEDG